MKVRVRLFANLRETAGQELLELELADGLVVREILSAVVKQCPELRTDLAGEPSGLRAAVNLEFAPWDRPLRDGDEVTLIPPVGGG